jgi:hypothetical protein
MYIAFKKISGQPQYFLRESCIIEGRLTFRDIYSLGKNPSLFIKYVGGNAFYFDETIEEAILQSNATYDSDELEDLFWPWIKPDIKRAIDTFRSRSNRKKDGPDLITKQILSHTHNFDKRRLHYLKFASMDQGPVEQMPLVLFKVLAHKSRDEIEQYFFRQEFSLGVHELKSYVYTVFNLQSFFSSFMAKTMPHVLDQEKVDLYFLEKICMLNKKLFGSTSPLEDYMIRYAIMFFDHAYADTTLLDDFAKSFMNRHRVFKPRPQKTIPADKALKIFNLNKKKLKTMTKKSLTKLYRRLARKVHPDTGGSHEKFVELNDAYETLLEEIKSL